MIQGGYRVRLERLVKRLAVRRWLVALVAYLAVFLTLTWLSLPYVVTWLLAIGIGLVVLTWLGRREAS